tara:strand:- start:5962 stop:6762 length:801 start_codon:yes stop_codon:yes gene_type:complete
MYKQKYLEYKQKYLVEKNQLYGGATAAQRQIANIKEEASKKDYDKKQKAIASGKADVQIDILNRVNTKYPETSLKKLESGLQLTNLSDEENFLHKLTVRHFLEMCKNLNVGEVADELGLNHLGKFRSVNVKLKDFNTQLYAMRAGVGPIFKYLHIDREAAIKTIVLLCKSLNINPYSADVTGSDGNNAEAVQQRLWEVMVLTGIVGAHSADIEPSHYLPVLQTPLIEAGEFMIEVYRILDELEKEARSHVQRTQHDAMEVGDSMGV